jgi:hypothetical protein
MSEDDEFLIEVDEDLEEVEAIPLTPAETADSDFSGLESIELFSGGSAEPRSAEDATTLVPTGAEDHAHDDPFLAGDVLRAKEAGVSLASSKIEPLPFDRHAVISVDDQRTPVEVTKSVVIIGRSKELADVVLESEKVSRQHAAIIHARGEFFLEDLHSTNGTFVADRKVKRVRLSPGLTITIGGFKLRLRMV